MIFAAGLGTRLRPLTDTRPKALAEVNGAPLLEIAIRRLQRAGVREMIINIHYLGGQIVNFLERKAFPGLHIAISDERDLLLDTGGGLKKAAWFFDDGQPFIVYNADVLTTLDLRAMYDDHAASGAIATLAVRERASSRAFLFDAEGRLSGWRNTATGAERICRHAETLYPLAFSGIHVIHPRLFDHMPAQDVFSIVDVYLDVAARESILAWRHNADLWLDVGKPEQLARAQELWPPGFDQ
jgi:NDP-sugar pyrophosphorylase family protein